MAKQVMRRSRQPRVAEEIMAGMRELERAMDAGRSLEEILTVRTVHRPASKRQRDSRAKTDQEKLG